MPLFPLEDFDQNETSSIKASATRANTPTLSESDLEAARLSGYETGYQAGWDDASKADENQRDHISAEFARNIQDLGFTFHEARSHVMKSLEPLLAGMVEKVLPNLVSETIGQAIVEELLPIAADAADTPIQVVIYPDGRETLDALLKQNTSLPLEIIEEDTLAEGQVYLKMGSIEKQIDLTGAIHSIGQAISGLYAINEKAKQNG